MFLFNTCFIIIVIIIIVLIVNGIIIVMDIVMNESHSPWSCLRFIILNLVCTTVNQSINQSINLDFL